MGVSSKMGVIYENMRLAATAELILQSFAHKQCDCLAQALSLLKNHENV